MVGCCKHSTEPSGFSTRWDTISISTCTRQHGVTYGQVPYWTQNLHSAHTRTRTQNHDRWVTGRMSQWTCVSPAQNSSPCTVQHLPLYRLYSTSCRDLPACIWYGTPNTDRHLRGFSQSLQTNATPTAIHYTVGSLNSDYTTCIKHRTHK
jgi:hypothetical protein